MLFVLLVVKIFLGINKFCSQWGSLLWFCFFNVMISLLQGYVQQYQLYNIRGVSQERNAVTEKTRNRKGRTLDIFKVVLPQKKIILVFFGFQNYVN